MRNISFFLLLSLLLMQQKQAQQLPSEDDPTRTEPHRQTGASLTTGEVESLIDVLK